MPAFSTSAELVILPARIGDLQRHVYMNETKMRNGTVTTLCMVDAQVFITYVLDAPTDHTSTTSCNSFILAECTHLQSVIKKCQETTAT